MGSRIEIRHCKRPYHQKVTEYDKDGLIGKSRIPAAITGRRITAYGWEPMQVSNPVCALSRPRGTQGRRLPSVN